MMVHADYAIITLSPADPAQCMPVFIASRYHVRNQLPVAVRACHFRYSGHLSLACWACPAASGPLGAAYVDRSIKNQSNRNF